jgi:hypothetical protein
MLTRLHREPFPHGLFPQRHRNVSSPTCSPCETRARRFYLLEQNKSGNTLLFQPSLVPRFSMPPGFPAATKCPGHPCCSANVKILRIGLMHRWSRFPSVFIGQLYTYYRTLQFCAQNPRANRLNMLNRPAHCRLRPASASTRMWFVGDHAFDSAPKYPAAKAAVSMQPDSTAFIPTRHFSALSLT